MAKLEQALSLAEPLILNKNEVWKELGFDVINLIDSRVTSSSEYLKDNEQIKESILELNGKNDDLDYGQDVEDFLKQYVKEDLDVRGKIAGLQKNKKESMLSHLSHMVFKYGRKVIIFIIKRIFKLAIRIAWNAIRIVTSAFWRFIARPLLSLLVDFLLSPVGLAVVGIAALTGVGYVTYKYVKGEPLWGSMGGIEGISNVPEETAGEGGEGTSTESVKGKGYTTKNESVEVKKIFEEVSKNTGVPVQTFTGIAARESTFDPKAKNKNSSAGGLFQFIDKTWAGIKRDYGTKYGIPDIASKYDPYYATVGEAAFIKEEIYPAIKSVKSNITPTDVYLGHFLGPSAAKVFLTALQKNPKEAAYLVTPKAAKWNPAYYYDKKGKPRSLQQMYDLLNGYMVASTEVASNKTSTQSTTVAKTNVNTNKPKDDPNQAPVALPVSNKNKQYFRVGNAIASY